VEAAAAADTRPAGIADAPTRDRTSGGSAVGRKGRELGGCYGRRGWGTRTRWGRRYRNDTQGNPRLSGASAGCCARVVGESVGAVKPSRPSKRFGLLLRRLKLAEMVPGKRRSVVNFLSLRRGDGAGGAAGCVTRGAGG